MKKAGPILLVVLVALIGYKFLVPPPGGNEFREDFERVIDGIAATPEEQTYLRSIADKNHASAFKKALKAPPESQGDSTANSLYMKDQFVRMIEQATSDQKTTLAESVRKTGINTLGPRQFPSSQPVPAK